MARIGAFIVSALVALALLVPRLLVFLFSWL